MVRTHHERQPTVVTDQPFIIALQFNYSSLGIEVGFCDKVAWITSTTLSLIPILEAGGSVSSFMHISRTDDVVNVNPCCIIEVGIFRIHEGLEYLFADAWI